MAGRSQFRRGRGPARGGGGARPVPEAKELDYRRINGSRSHLHLALARNKSGIFLKLGNSTRSGEKVFVPGSGVRAFAAALTQLADRAAQLPASYEAARDADGNFAPIASDLVRAENRTIFLDLKSNQNGLFIRVSMLLGNSRGRNVCHVHQESIQDLADAVAELVAAHAPALDEAVAAHEARHAMDIKITSGAKDIVVSGDRNERGAFVRMEEKLGGRSRGVVTVPAECVAELIAALRKSVQ